MVSYPIVHYCQRDKILPSQNGTYGPITNHLSRLISHQWPWHTSLVSQEKLLLAWKSFWIYIFYRVCHHLEAFLLPHYKIIIPTIPKYQHTYESRTLLFLFFFKNANSQATAPSLRYGPGPGTCSFFNKEQSAWDREGKHLECSLDDKFLP